MEKLKSRLEEKLQDKNGGVSAALYHNGSMEFCSYGPDSPDENSLYEIGSITKSLTALLFLILEEKGRVDRNDPIKKHMPEIEFQDPGVADIRLEQLMLHSSGLPRMPDNMPRSNPKDPYADYTKSYLCEFLSTHQLGRESVGAVTYSNMGYGLLGHLLERTTDKMYGDLIKEEVLSPLNMQASFINTNSGDVDIAPGYDENGNEVPNWHFDILVGAGGLISTAYDMSLFLESQIFPPENEIGQCIKNSQLPRHSIGNEKKRGFGWSMNHLRSKHDLIWQNGGTGGYRSFMGFVPEEERGMVVLANCQLELDQIAAETFEVE